MVILAGHRDAGWQEAAGDAREGTNHTDCLNGAGRGRRRGAAAAASALLLAAAICCFFGWDDILLAHLGSEEGGIGAPVNWITERVAARWNKQWLTVTAFRLVMDRLPSSPPHRDTAAAPRAELRMSFRFDAAPLRWTGARSRKGAEEEGVAMATRRLVAEWCTQEHQEEEDATGCRRRWRLTTTSGRSPSAS